jgi:TRAP-type C4-dicarboxylate transport system permease small subunit
VPPEPGAAARPLLQRIVVGGLLLATIAVMLTGVVLRYLVLPVTDWLDMDPVNFFWVEETGELLLVWLTLVGAGIGVAEGSHFALSILTHRLPLRAQHVIAGANMVLIAGFGALVACVGARLAIANAGLESPALGLSLVWTYGAAFIGGVMIVAYALVSGRRLRPSHA